MGLKYLFGSSIIHYLIITFIVFKINMKVFTVNLIERRTI